MNKGKAAYRLGLTMVLAAATAGCPNTPPTGGSTGSTGDAGAGGNGGQGTGGNAGNGGSGGSGGSGGGAAACVEIPRMDVVFVIDNSRSMADKQLILARTIPTFVRDLINPPCHDPAGVQPPTQPANPTDACPAGLVRAFAPQTDMHFGVISTSIGGHGSDACPNSDTATKECQPNPNLSNNDKGRLLDRGDQCSLTTIPTYANKKFLAWDSEQVLTPPGETQVNDGMGGGLAPRLRDLVNGAGQIGCGYEAQLESVYRFLVDPNPYETISVTSGMATPMGTDQVLLAQRKAFLRPDSLVSVIMLTDEDDCSTKEYGDFYIVNQNRIGTMAFRMARPRQECATNPNDPCCRSCAQDQTGCPVDPNCKDPNGGTGPATLSNSEDSINLRCWDQKRRFGRDFLYPLDRYTKAFTAATIADRDGNIVQNPLFSDLDTSDNISEIRGAEKVLVAGIVGVPWQDIARDKTDISKGFKNAAELAAPISGVNGSTWDVILGDPAKLIKPLDPLMISSVEKRKGSNPILNVPLADGTTMPNTNPINGHEWTISDDDLQYTCIFPLIPGTERNCTDSTLTSCECTNNVNDNPTCQADPNNMGRPTLQVRGKAYPGKRPLQMLQSLGDQALVTSICPAQLDDQALPTHAYRPFSRSFTDWLTRRSCPMTP